MRELYIKNRPKKFEHVIGQDEAVKMLSNMLKNDSLAHAIILSGPSGTGKTTIARILARMLGCRMTAHGDVSEINIADFRGIDMVRDIRAKMGLSPLGGKAKVWILDECHMLRTDAQNAFLKILEDGDETAYFILCTTEPQKLIPTVRNRCTHVKTKSVPPILMHELLLTVCKKEQKKIHSTVHEKIIEVSSGSPRKALVLLHQVLELDTKDEQLEVIQNSDVEKQAIELCRALMNPKVQWPAISALIKSIDEEPESIRRLMLAYMGKVALNKPYPKREVALIQCFEDNYYDCGLAGLIQSCFMAIIPTKTR